MDNGVKVGMFQQRCNAWRNTIRWVARALWRYEILVPMSFFLKKTEEVRRRRGGVGKSIGGTLLPRMLRHRPFSACRGITVV